MAKKARAPPKNKNRMKPRYWRQAAKELAERDPVLQQLIARFDGVSLQSRGDAFATLARSIVGQQISVKAADSVWQKFTSCVGDMNPAAVYGAGDAKLRACGLSGRKVEYLQDLARHFLDGRPDIARWKKLDDEALISELTKVKGIGRWSAEMFLIFFMMRPNVLPLDDIGLERAMSIHYNHNKPLSKLKMRAIAKHWLPWRSVATWYLWRSLDPLPVEY